MIQFSDTTGKSGLIQECEMILFGDSGYGQISSNPNRLNYFTNLLNQSMVKIVGAIYTCDGKWQFDDSNLTGATVATVSLIAGTNTYTLPLSYLTINRVEIMGTDGIFKKLEQLDTSDITVALSEYEKDQAPNKYDLDGDNLILYGTPQTTFNTLTNGLKIYYTREPYYFINTDTIKTPGFSPLHHRLVALLASLDYAMNRMLPQTPMLKEQSDMMMVDMIQYYSVRDKDTSSEFKPIIINYR